MTSARDVIERHLNQKAGLVLTSEANADAILAALDAAGYAVVPKSAPAPWMQAARCECEACRKAAKETK